MKLIPFYLPARAFILCAVASVLISQNSIYGQAVWQGTQTPLNWSIPNNWLPAAVPTGAVRFENLGTSITNGTVTSIVNGNYVVTAMEFVHTGNYHTLKIEEDHTLTVQSTATSGNVFYMGGTTVNDLARTTFTGGGALVINSSRQNFYMQNSANAETQAMQLNLAGLGRFEANVNQFLLGTGTGRARFDFMLAEENTITANLMRIGNSTSSSNGTSTFLLGGETTTFNSDLIVIAAGRAAVNVNFAASGGGELPYFKIRATDGEGRADLVIGNQSTTYSSQAGGSSVSTGNLNLGSGNIDFLLDELVLGIAGSADASGGIGHGVGNLTMANGVIDANTVTLGRGLVRSTDTTNAGGGAASLHANLTVAGGDFRAGTIIIAENQDDNQGRDVNIRGELNITGGTATVADDIVMSTYTSATPTTLGVAQATLNVTGGTLIVGGNITEGVVGGTSTVNINGAGAVLDMTGGYINVDTLNGMAGTLKNVSEIYDGEMGTGTLTVSGGAGVFILDGDIAYSGDTKINSGTLQVGAGNTGGGLGAGSVTINGTLQFNRSDHFVVHQELLGSNGIIRQIGSGKTSVTGVSAGLGVVTVEVENGIFHVADAGALGEMYPEIYVKSGAEFQFITGASQTMNTAFALHLESNSILGVGIGDILDTYEVFATPGSDVTLKLYGSDVAAGSYQVLKTDEEGGGLDDINLQLLMSDATNYRVDAVNKTDTSYSVQIVSMAEEDQVFWRGSGVAGHGNIWSVSSWNGSAISNWALDAAGTMSPVVPGASTEVIFSALGASQQDNMRLGADMSILGLRVQSSAPVTLLDDPLYLLTIAGSNAITLESGAGLTTLASRLHFADASPLLTNNSGNALVLSGGLSGNAFRQEGTGVVRLLGEAANQLVGVVEVVGGALELGKADGVGAISDGLDIGSSGTVRLLGNHQIADSAAVDVANGGVFDMNGKQDIVGALTGGGMITNSATGTTGVFGMSGSVGGADFAGTLQDGSGSAVLALVKDGSGLQILSNINNYSGGTTVLGGTLRMGVAGSLGTGSLVVDGASAILDMQTFSYSATGVTVDGGGQIIGNNSVLTSATEFQMKAGEVHVALAGSTGLRKSGDGYVLLTGDNSYTGTTVLEGGGVMRLAHSNALGAGGIDNGTTINGDTNGVTLELSNNITVNEDLVIAARSLEVAALSNHSGNNTWVGNISFSAAGGANYNIESQAGLLTISGNLAGISGVTGTRNIRLSGEGDGLITGAVQAGSGTFKVIKLGSGTWTLMGANTYTGATEINEGTLKFGTDLTTSTTLLFGSANDVTTVGTLDLTDASARFTGLTVQTNSTSSNQVLIGAGKNLTINGNVRVGTTLEAATNTRLVVSGEGVFNVTGTSFQVGGYTTSTTGNGNTAVADFSGLAEMNITLSATSGTVRVSNNTTGGNAPAYSHLLLAKDSTITANSLIIGGSPLYTSASSDINGLFLGSGTNVLHVNSITMGVGARDFGKLLFQGATGTLELRGADGVGRTNLSMGTGSGNTGTGSQSFANVFDVSGHYADLLFGNVAIGTQEYRATTYANVFAFDQGVLDIQNLTLGTRSTRTNSNGASEPRITNVDFNLGGGLVNIENGILNMALVTKYNGEEQTNKVHTVNSNLNISGNAQVTIGATDGVAIRMAGAATTYSEANAEINLTGAAVVSILGDLVKVGGAGATSAVVNLNGATLDMRGNKIGDAINQVDLAARAGVLRNLGELNGGGNLIKTTLGTLTLDGLNTYTGRTVVEAGTLRVLHTDAIRESSGLTVNSGGTFHFARVTGGHDLDLRELTLNDGATIGVSVGNLINVTGAATANGTITVDFYGVSGFSPTNPIKVINAGVGHGLGGADYVRGNYYNITNFTVDDIAVEADGVYLNITALAELEEAWWKGGYSDTTQDHVWAVTDGATSSNWTKDSAGVINTPLVPGSITKLYFSAVGAANQGSMQLGSDMAVGSLVFQDSTSDILLDDMAHSLTLNSQDAISVTANSQEVKLVTNLLLAHSAPEIDIATGELLEIAGILGGNGATKLGAGTLLLSGHLANNYAGLFKVQQGVLHLGKVSGVNAINEGGLEVSNASVWLMASEQIANAAIVTVGSGGFLNLNGFNETVGGIEGTGTVRNVNNGTTSVLTVGASDVSSEFDGVLANGGSLPTLEVVKTGSGTWTLGGESENTYTGVTSVFGGVLELNKLEGLNAIRAALIVGNGLDAAVVRWLASHQIGDAESNVVIRNLGELDLNGFNETIRSIVMEGGQVNGSTSTLTATQDFDLRSGTVNARLAGSVNLVKSTTGEVLLAGKNLYTGETQILGGILKVGVDDALPTIRNVVFGNGTTTGTLDLNGFDQTIGAMTVSVGSGHQVLIGEGSVLTQNGAFTFGGVAGNGNFVASGGGEWFINTTGSFNVRNTESNNSSILTFDLAGLNIFRATVADFNLGFGTGVQTRAPARLAMHNTITANLMRVGAGGGTGTQTGTVLTLGETNVFNVNSIMWGTGRTSMTAGIRTDVVNTPSVTIRGRTGGTSRADLWLGNNGNSITGGVNGGSSSPSATVDLRGANLDFRLNNFGVANSAFANSTTGGIGYAFGTFSFNMGTIDATNLIVGRLMNLDTVTVAGGNAGALHGTFNMQGGQLITDNFIIAQNQDGTTGVNGNIKAQVNISAGTVNVTNDISIASHTHATSPSAGYADGSLSLTGGSITVGGNLTEGNQGDNRSYVLLDGATLDMTGGTINVDTFETQSGTLKNVEQIYKGSLTAADLIKTGADKLLVLEGQNNYTGATIVQQGNLQVGRLGSGTTGTAAVSVAATASLSGSGSVRGNASFVSGATLRPGDQGGSGLARLTFEGNLNMATGSTTILQLGGASYNFGADFAAALAETPSLTEATWIVGQTGVIETFTGNHDSLNIEGELTFQGKLVVANMTGYQAGYGDVFNLLDWVDGTFGITLPVGTQTSGGEFGNLTLPEFEGISGLLWDVSLLQSHGILYVVPEPSRALLLLAGLTWIGLRRCRRGMR
jgi:autotransporter-associated beta strand protein